MVENKQQSDPHFMLTALNKKTDNTDTGIQARWALVPSLDPIKASQMTPWKANEHCLGWVSHGRMTSQVS